MENSKQATLTKYMVFKKKNKRISIFFGKGPNGELVLVQETKRLISFKDRDILKTKIIFGMDTFLALGYAYNYIQESPSFVKDFNPEIGQCSKDIYSVNVNFKSRK